MDTSNWRNFVGRYTNITKEEVIEKLKAAKKRAELRKPLSSEGDMRGLCKVNVECFKFDGISFVDAFKTDLTSEEIEAKTDGEEASVSIDKKALDRAAPDTDIIRFKVSIVPDVKANSPQEALDQAPEDGVKAEVVEPKTHTMKYGVGTPREKTLTIVEGTGTDSEQPNERLVKTGFDKLREAAESMGSYARQLAASIETNALSKSVTYEEFKDLEKKASDLADDINRRQAEREAKKKANQDNMVAVLRFFEVPEDLIELCVKYQDSSIENGIGRYLRNKILEYVTKKPVESLNLTERQVNVIRKMREIDTPMTDIIAAIQEYVEANKVRDRERAASDFLAKARSLKVSRMMVADGRLTEEEGAKHRADIRAGKCPVCSEEQAAHTCPRCNVKCCFGCYIEHTMAAYGTVPPSPEYKEGTITQAEFDAQVEAVETKIKDQEWIANYDGPKTCPDCGEDLTIVGMKAGRVRCEECWKSHLAGEVEEDDIWGEYNDDFSEPMEEDEE